MFLQDTAKLVFMQVIVLLRLMELRESIAEQAWQKLARKLFVQLMQITAIMRQVHNQLMKKLSLALAVMVNIQAMAIEILLIQTAHVKVVILMADMQ